MLCSVSKSGGKPTSSWLDRLRSSKGFPSGTDLDLDQFLTHPHCNDDQDDSVPPKVVPTGQETGSSRSDHPAETSDPGQGEHVMFDIMSNVLAELFIMGGDSNGLPKLKCSRKQPNPRFCGSLNSPAFSSINTSCHNSNDAAVSNDRPAGKKESASASPMSDDNSGVGLVKLVENTSSFEEGDEEEEKDKGSGNLSGFSRTEVTVIDTSFTRWKFEKMLFRKKNVWKVRDKKGKTANLTKKKKRKSTSLIDDENIYGGDAKKAKVLDGLGGFSEKGNGGASKEEYHQSNKSQIFTTSSDIFGKALKKKQAAALNLEKGSSSVVLIKSIPANKKSGTSIPKGCPKSSQKQHQKVT